MNVCDTPSHQRTPLRDLTVIHFHHGKGVFKMAPQIRSMNNRFDSEAKLPWSYDYPLANHIATNKSCLKSANREMPLISHLYPSFGYLRKFSPGKTEFTPQQTHTKLSFFLPFFCPT